MKKLKLYEEVDFQSYRKETIETQIGTAEVKARWLWDEGADYYACEEFYNQHKDIIAQLETPVHCDDLLLKMFLAGCSYGYALRDDRTEIGNILKIKDRLE